MCEQEVGNYDGALRRFGNYRSDDRVDKHPLTRQLSGPFSRREAVEELQPFFFGPPPVSVRTYGARRLSEAGLTSCPHREHTLLEFWYFGLPKPSGFRTSLKAWVTFSGSNARTCFPSCSFAKSFKRFRAAASPSAHQAPGQVPNTALAPPGSVLCSAVFLRGGSQCPLPLPGYPMPPGVPLPLLVTPQGR